MSDALHQKDWPAAIFFSMAYPPWSSRSRLLNISASLLWARRSSRISSLITPIPSLNGLHIISDKGTHEDGDRGRQGAVMGESTIHTQITDPALGSPMFHLEVQTSNINPARSTSAKVSRSSGQACWVQSINKHMGEEKSRRHQHVVYGSFAADFIDHTKYPVLTLHL